MEPLHGVLLGDLVARSHFTLASLSACYSLSWSLKNYVEIHTVNTSRWVILDTQINMLIDTESEVTGGAEVILVKFVFLNLQSRLKKLQGLLTTDGDVGGDLLVTTNGKSTDCISGLGEHWLLSSQLLKNLKEETSRELVLFSKTFLFTTTWGQNRSKRKKGEKGKYEP